MDSDSINVDTVLLFQALVKIKQIKATVDDYKNSVSGLNSVNSSEISSLSELPIALGNINNACDDIDSLLNLIKRNVEIFKHISVDAALLFSMYENGSIDENGDLIVDSSSYNEFGMIYNQYLYSAQYSSYDKTLASNGCGFFSLLSVITCNTGHLFFENEVNELAAIAMEPIGLGNDQRMEYLADYLSNKYDFSWSKGPVANIVPALHEGKSVIALIDDSSHFVSITGITNEGYLIVNDTNGLKYQWDYVHKKRVDEQGFDYNNDEIDISASGVDSNGDGLNDDVWFFEFNK